jgi:hypothetical protein
MSDSQSDEEHVVSVKSVQVYRGSITEGMVGDGGVSEETMEMLDFSHEDTLSLQCSCGDGFRKYRTAVTHLQEVRDE